MGSLFSPSVPRYAPPVYVPSVSTPVSSGQSGGNQDEDRQSSGDEESVRDFIRRTNRGRSQLIQTGYRGVLTDFNSLAPQRKNLLGE